MGTLFVIEGVDGAGKQTQTELLYKRLIKEGKNPFRVSFPDYESESSYAIKLYLAGEFGKKATDVSAKTASTFYALDRYVSYKQKWEKVYNEGRIIIADRYTTSNMIHQASKLGINDKDQFLDWLCEFEYGIYALPKPDKVIFLDVDPKISEEITKERKNKATGGDRQDIHESDREYIKKSYDNAKYIAKKYGWSIIDCSPNGDLRTIEDIADEVYEKVVG